MESLSSLGPVCCGIDWAEDHHDVALVDVEGIVVPGCASATTQPAVLRSRRRATRSTALAQAPGRGAHQSATFWLHAPAASGRTPCLDVKDIAVHN